MKEDGFSPIMTTTTITIHRKGDDPYSGELIIHISLEDEGAGKYVVLKQDENEVRIDFNEVPLIVKAIEVLKKEQKNWLE